MSAGIEFMFEWISDVMHQENLEYIPIYIAANGKPPNVEARERFERIRNTLRLFVGEMKWMGVLLLDKDADERTARYFRIILEARSYLINLEKAMELDREQDLAARRWDDPGPSKGRLVVTKRKRTKLNKKSKQTRL